MFCQNCGTALSENQRFCPSCGVQQDAAASPQAAPPAGRVGFSPRIHDPAFALIMKKINRGSLIFTLVLSLTALIGFTVAGVMEAGGFELPSSLWIGLGLAGLLWLIYLIQGWRRRRDTSWEGTIVEKKVDRTTRTREDPYNHSLKYTVVVRKDDHSLIKLNYTQELYDYYQEGDRVRHHAGLAASHLLEKYDKSADEHLYCLACSTKNPIDQDRCRRCKAPLLN
ncbi:MAG: zinc ribbon domain-containing protein [Eubacteriales bacterium]|nr:zinc ribbon domain-containing protein [Eubacteriales bacterium]